MHFPTGVCRKVGRKHQVALANDLQAICAAPDRWWSVGAHSTRLWSRRSRRELRSNWRTSPLLNTHERRIRSMKGSERFNPVPNPERGGSDLADTAAEIPGAVLGLEV